MVPKAVTSVIRAGNPWIIINYTMWCGGMGSKWKIKEIDSWVIEVKSGVHIMKVVEFLAPHQEWASDKEKSVALSPHRSPSSVTRAKPGQAPWPSPTRDTLALADCDHGEHASRRGGRGVEKWAKGQSQVLQLVPPQGQASLGRARSWNLKYSLFVLFLLLFKLWQHTHHIKFTTFPPF